MTQCGDLGGLLDRLEHTVKSGQKPAWEDIQYALSQVTAGQDQGVYGLLCYYAACSVFDSGSQEECLRYLNESIRCLIGTPQEKKLAECYNMLGLVSHSQNNPVAAMEHYEKAGVYAKKYGQPRLYSLIMSNMADVYHRVGAYERAGACYRECIRGLDRIAGYENAREDSIYCRALAGYGYCLIMTGEHQEAFAVACRLEERDGEQEYAASTRLAMYGFLALLYHTAGDRERAEESMEKAIRAVIGGCTILEDFDCILNLIHYLIRVEKFDRLRQVLDYLEPQAAIERNEGFLLQLLLYRLCYCSDDMDQEQFQESMNTFCGLRDRYENEENAQLLRMISLRDRLRKIEEEQKLLRKKNTRLLYQAEHDELSGLYNKRYLNRHMEEMFDEALHKKLALGVLFVDIDFFKQMNDRYGHQKGDDCITVISEAVRECIPEDFAARYGGDEFVIITIGRSREYLEERAQMLVDYVRKREIPNVDSPYRKIMTITVGAVHAVPHKPNKMWDFLSAADEALYAQKEEQKGRVRFYKVQEGGL